jgi:thiol-disulfide isomerase/thioredoxin
MAGTTSRTSRRAALLVMSLGTLGPLPLAAQESGIAVGTRAPTVVVHDLDGNSIDLSRYIGVKPVFLEFWATWCESCEQLLPRVRAAQAAYGKEVEFIGVNITVNDPPEKVRQYIETHRLPFRTLYDDEGTSTRAYDVPATSYVVIVDRTGKVVYTGTGGTQRFEAALGRVTQN